VPLPTRIRAKAPLRLSFAGGGTDVSPFLEREGGCVLSATISRYSWGTLSPREDSQIHLESADLGALFYFDTRSNLVYDGKMDLAKAAIRTLNGQDSRGFDLFLKTDAPPGSGLGSSSSLMVNMIGLLREFKSLPLTEYETADMAFQIERKQLGIQGGMQDQYAAVFGGFNFIEFHADHVIVNPLRINRDAVNELEHNLLLCFTGKTRANDGIISDQVGRYENNDEATLEGLRKQKSLAVEMKNLLLQRRLDDFGAALDEAWKYKKKLSPKVTNPHIDEMYEEARRHGAVGGKITGAGGGGYLLLYCEYEKKHKVAEAVCKAGAQTAEFAFDFHGLQTWRMNGAACNGNR
jgi:D-glycero-alpha-D-manno-heptose-7-phosphate kinase